MTTTTFYLRLNEHELVTFHLKKEQTVYVLTKYESERILAANHICLEVIKFVINLLRDQMAVVYFENQNYDLKNFYLDNKYDFSDHYSYVIKRINSDIESGKTNFKIKAEKTEGDYFQNTTIYFGNIFLKEMEIYELEFLKSIEIK